MIEIKGEKWNFKKFIPDIDDMNAKSNACLQFLDFLHKKNNLDMNNVDIFNCGFARGCAWMMDKLFDMYNNNIDEFKIKYAIWKKNEE